MATNLQILLWPALLLALPLAGCEKQATEVETPVLVDALDGETLDGILATATSAGLRALDPQGRVVPGLAQSWRIADDGLSIVFRLRPALFSDGGDLQAADVVATIEAARAGRQGTLARDLLAGVTRISSPVESIVELQLSTPQPELLELLASPLLGIRPRRGTATAGPFLRAAAAAPTGNRGGDLAHLQRNPEFYDSAALAFETVDIGTRPAEEAILRFNRGETDLVLGGGIDGYASARVTARRDTLLTEQRRSTLSLLVNYGQPLLAERNIRRALQLAINRERLSQTMYGTLAALPVPALAPGNIADYAPPRPDWADLPFATRQLEATRLIAETGHGKDDLQFAVAISSNPDDTRLLTEIAADLAGIGVQLKLIRRSPEAHRQAVRDGDFELALARIDTPTDSPLPFLVGNLCDHNQQGICLKEADELLAASWQAPTRAERLAMLASAERLWAEDGAAIGLLQPIGWLLVATQVNGIAANAAGRHDLRYVTLSPERKFIP